MNLSVNVPKGKTRRIQVYFNNDVMMDQKMDGGSVNIDGFEYRKAIKILVDGNSVYNKTVRSGPLSVASSCGCTFALAQDAASPISSPPSKPKKEKKAKKENSPVMGTTPKPFSFWSKNKNED